MSDRALRAGVALVALAGVAVAGYLTYVHYQPEALICTAGGGCETVQVMTPELRAPPRPHTKKQIRFGSLQPVEICLRE